MQSDCQLCRQFTTMIDCLAHCAAPSSAQPCDARYQLRPDRARSQSWQICYAFRTTYKKSTSPRRLRCNTTTVMRLEESDWVTDSAQRWWSPSQHPQRATGRCSDLYASAVLAGA